MTESVQLAPRGDLPRREGMQTPEEVVAMLRLKALGWGIRRIAKELGCSHMTVRRYLSEGGWVPYHGRGRPRTLAGFEDWVAERFRRHGGNADVVRQELEREKGIRLTLRTIERQVAPLRQELAAAARATVRFETPPGRQMQIDFGERRVRIGEDSVKVFLFVATLGYSRRLHTRAFGNERQENWFAGMESAFQRFGGVTEEVLFDNDRGLVIYHDRVTREVAFNARLHAFARHWGFHPRACAPYRARTKGKDERGVGYVKNNAIAGRRFDSWAALEAHLEEWTREVADKRVHGTTGALRQAQDEGADRAVLARRSRGPATDRRASAVRGGARAGAQGSGRLRDRGRRQRLFGAVAADRGPSTSSGACRSRSPARCCGSAMPVVRWRCMPAARAAFSAASIPPISPVSPAAARRRAQRRRIPRRQASQPCCARWPSMSAWRAGAGDGPRTPAGDAHPAQADRDPRSAR